MCIINVALPGTDKGSSFWTEAVNHGLGINNQGYGFAIKKAPERDHDSNATIVRKGFFNLQEMWDALNSYNPQKEDLVIIHGRIRTAGNVDASNCHPFILAEHKDDIIATDIVTDKPVMFHNGSFSNYAYNGSELSDTYHIVKQLFGNKYTVSFLEGDPEEFKAVYEKITGGNRIAFILPNSMEPVLFGDFTEDSGYYFSNGCYKPYTPMGKEAITPTSGTNFRELFLGPAKQVPDMAMGPKPTANIRRINELGPVIPYTKLDLSTCLKVTYNNCKEFLLQPSQTTGRLSSSKHYYITGSDTKEPHSSIFDEVKVGLSLRELGSETPKVTFVLISSLYKEFNIFPRTAFKQKYVDYMTLMKELPSPSMGQISKIVRGLSTSAVGVETLKVKPRRVGRVLKTAIVEWLVQLGYAHKLPTIYFPDLVEPKTTENPAITAPVETLEPTGTTETNDLSTEDMS